MERNKKKRSSGWGNKWIIFSDFNDVTLMGEKLGGGKGEKNLDF